jgi:hypothetical protein
MADNGHSQLRYWNFSDNDFLNEAILNFSRSTIQISLKSTSRSSFPTTCRAREKSYDLMLRRFVSYSLTSHEQLELLEELPCTYILKAFEPFDTPWPVPSSAKDSILLALETISSSISVPVARHSLE